MKVHLIAAATLAFGTTAALAQDPAEEAAEQQVTQAIQQEDEDLAEEEEDDRGSEVICRTEKVTGSLTRRVRTCLTRDEWNGVQSRTRDELNRMGRGAAGSQCIPDNPLQPRC